MDRLYKEDIAYNMKLCHYASILEPKKMTQLFDLHGKTAIIIGASSGLGEQFARCLSAAGSRVILAARRIDKLKDLAADLNNTRAIQIDASDKQSVKACFAQLENDGEKIDICVNSAGIAALTPIFEEDDQNNFEAIVQTNLIGVWYVTKAVANHMKSRRIHGSIINIASVNGQNKLREGLSAYASSKAAVIQMTKALVGELSPYKIRINCISPGLFHTPLTDYKLNTSEQKEAMKKIIPLGFVATPKDLDGLLLLLASNAHSSYITGTCITVDGGVSWGGS
ncbi:MAG: SDR family oxidoreductase [Rickettsiaceae bacterium]|nr:SDR family oxidoreductase [Rickettsiaceae bacterium]